MAENCTLDTELKDMSVGEPDKVSEKDDGAEKYKALVETLSKKEFYDIKQKSVKTISPESGQASGQPAIQSDQGSEETCSSHSMGKVAVDSLDSYGFDCDQETIIHDLKKKHQPDGAPIHLSTFDQQNLPVTIWRKGNKSKLYLVNLAFKVQSEYVDARWSGLKIDIKDLVKHGMKLVVEKKTTDVKGKVVAAHALYVKSVEENSPKDYTFKCMNSWGEKDKNIVLKKTDLQRLHYVSLYCMKMVQLLAPVGNFAEYQGCRLGVYLEAGVHNGCPFYEQLHTADTEKDGYFIYRDDEGTVWGISKSLCEKHIAARNKSGGDHLPKEGWEPFYDDANPEDTFTVSEEAPTLCGAITISGVPTTAEDPECNGRYLPTLQYSAGRQVFKHEAEDRFLLVPPGYVAWEVGTKLDSVLSWVLVSGCAPTLCPAEKRAESSQRIARKHWRYWDTKQKKVIRDDATIKISCDTCKLEIK